MHHHNKLFIIKRTSFVAQTKLPNKENAFNKGDPRIMISTIKIFYYNATEIAPLVGMSPFSSGRTALLKAWKSVNKTSFEKAKKSFESGKLEKIAKNFYPTTNDITKASYLSNGIEREPKILDIVEKSYSVASSSLEKDDDETVKDNNNKARQLFKFGGLIATGVSAFILNYCYEATTHPATNNNVTSISSNVDTTPESDFIETGLALSSLLLLGSVVYTFCSGRVSSSYASARQVLSPPPPTPVIERNCSIKYMYITPAKRPFEIKVGGRCDGLVKSKGEIIECKARQNKLFHKVYDTEKVQATMYLAIMNDIETKRFEAGGTSPIQLDYKVCKLVEEYQDEIDIHPIKFDIDFYETIRVKLVDITTLLYEAAILQDPRAQVKIFKMEMKSDDIREGKLRGRKTATFSSSSSDDESE